MDLVAQGITRYTLGKTEIGKNKNNKERQGANVLYMID
jgi:hypothetical protein